MDTLPNMHWTHPAWLPSVGGMSLLDDVTTAVTEAGDRLLSVWTPDSRPADREQMLAAAVRNEEISGEGLREALAALRPDARFAGDRLPGGGVAEDGVPGGAW